MHMKTNNGEIEKNLKSLLNENYNDGKFGTHQEMFTMIAQSLMHYHCILSGENVYRITELEFYYHEKEGNHNDPYTHCDDEQLTAGKWYFNGMGVDITFGNMERNVYGGILIRGIKKQGDVPVYISGPSNVLKELFSSQGDAFSIENKFRICELENAAAEESVSKLIAATRVGLTRKTNDSKNFFDCEYRYISDLKKEHKFKNKEAVIKQLILSGKLSREDEKRILGYNTKP